MGGGSMGPARDQRRAASCKAEEEVGFTACRGEGWHDRTFGSGEADDERKPVQAGSNNILVEKPGGQQALTSPSP